MLRLDVTIGFNNWMLRWDVTLLAYHCLLPRLMPLCLLPHSFCFLTAFTSSQFLLPHSNASVHNSLNIQQERMAAANAARAASDHAAKQAAQVTCTVGSKADEEVHRLQELLTSQASVQHV